MIVCFLLAIILGLLNVRLDFFNSGLEIILYGVVYVAVVSTMQIRKVVSASPDFGAKDLSESQVYTGGFSEEFDLVFDKIKTGIQNREKWQLVVADRKEGLLKYGHKSWAEIIIIKITRQSANNTMVKALSFPNYSATRFRKNGPHQQNVLKVKAILEGVLQVIR